MEYHSLYECLLLQLWCPLLGLLYYISIICFSAFPVKDTEAVQYAKRTRLSHCYVGTWAKDAATQTDTEAPPPALTQTNHYIHHIVIVFLITICGDVHVKGMHVHVQGMHVHVQGMHVHVQGMHVHVHVQSMHVALIVRLIV